MIYLIGGSARCGKSTLARQMRVGFDGQVLSGDSIRVALREMSQPQWHPDIFDKIIDPISEDDDPAKRIERLRRRDMVAWHFLEKYFDSVSFADDDVLVDGIIWPSMLAEYKGEHKAIFLVDTSTDQAERLIRIRDTEKYGNWMRDSKYTDEKIRKWAEFNIERSKTIIAECEEHGYIYFDIAKLGMEDAQKQALDFLTK